MRVKTFHYSWQDFGSMQRDLNKFLSSVAGVCHVTQSALAAVPGSHPTASSLSEGVCVIVWYEEPHVVQMSVREIELSQHVWAFLEKLNIKTVEQMRDWFLLGEFPKRFGKKSREEVREKLISLGLIT